MFDYAKKNVYFFGKETMKVIFETFKVENAEALRKAIADGIKGQFEDVRAKRLRLDNELKTEQIEFMKMRNTYYRNFGVDISHAAKDAIKEAIKRKNLVNTEVSREQWNHAYECLLDVSQNGITCIVCRDSFEKAETANKHLIDNHMEKLKEVLVEVLKW